MITWSYLCSLPVAGAWTYTNGTHINVVDYTTIKTSTNGTTWTTVTVPTASSGWLNLTSGSAGQVVAMDANQAYCIKTSNSGASWTRVNLPKYLAGGQGNVYGAGYGNSIFLAFDGTYVSTSSNGGTTWTAAAGGGLPLTVQTRNVVYGGGIWLLGFNTNAYMISSDTISWTGYTMPTNPDGNKWGSVVFGNGIFVATTSNTNNENFYVTRSADGVTWSTPALISVTVPPPSPNIETAPFARLAFGNGVFVGTTASFSVTSTDGISWDKTAGLWQGPTIYTSGLTFYSYTSNPYIFSGTYFPPSVVPASVVVMG